MNKTKFTLSTITIDLLDLTMIKAVKKILQENFTDLTDVTSKYTLNAAIRFHNGKAQLIYQISFVQEVDKPSRPTYEIDAMTGKILSYYDNLQTIEVGTDPGGNQKIGRYQYDTDFGKLDVSQSGNTCTMNNANVKTVDMKHGTTNSSAFSYSCPENTKKKLMASICH